MTVNIDMIRTVNILSGGYLYTRAGQIFRLVVGEIIFNLFGR